MPLLGNKSLCSLKLGPWRVYFMSSALNYFHSSRTLTKWLKSAQQLSILESQFRGGKSVLKWKEQRSLTCSLKSKSKPRSLARVRYTHSIASSELFCLFDGTNWFQSIALFSVINCVVQKLSGRIQISVWKFCFNYFCYLLIWIALVKKTLLRKK